MWLSIQPLGVGNTPAAAYRILSGQQVKENDMNWYLAVLKKYAVFGGRARRMEYWMFAIISTVIYIVLGVVDNVVGTTVAEAGILSSIYSLAVLIPGLAVSVRRLHDTGRSGWWLLVNLTCVGVFVILFFMFQAGNPGSNQYGPNPKESGGY